VVKDKFKTTSCETASSEISISNGSLTFEIVSLGLILPKFPVGETMTTSGFELEMVPITPVEIKSTVKDRIISTDSPGSFILLLFSAYIP